MIHTIRESGKLLRIKPLIGFEPYGWVGGFGTTWCNDPHEDMGTILLIQRLMGSPTSTDINEDFLTLAYQAIDD